MIIESIVLCGISLPDDGELEIARDHPGELKVYLNGKLLSEDSYEVKERPLFVRQRSEFPAGQYEGKFPLNEKISNLNIGEDVIPLYKEDTEKT